MQTTSRIRLFLLQPLLLALLVGLVRGAIFSYECNSLPPEAGWSVINEYCNPEQFVEDSWLVQHTQLCNGGPTGQQFDYTRSLVEYDGAPAWFIEWRIFGDGPQSEIPFTSPGLLSAYGFGPVLYHFVIARDRVRLAHDNPGETVYFDIAPSGPHIFRVEQRGIKSFAVFIDGQIVHSGVPGGPFPAYSPAVGIRAKTHATENWVYWDYVRWGDIPSDASGDFDSNGAIDSFDHFYFSECLGRSAEGEPAQPSCAWADMNSGGTVDCTDRDGFRAVWTGPDPPPVPPACAEPVPVVSEGGILVAALLTISAAILVLRIPKPRHPCRS